MKRAVSLLLVFVMLFTFCACGGSAGADNKGGEEEKLREITVDLSIFSEVTTQEDLNKAVADGKATEATLNADGTATYKLTKAQHEKTLSELRAAIQEGLDEMIGPDGYDYTEIKANEDYTKFTVKSNATEVNLMDSFAVLLFYMYGGFYQGFSGADADQVITVEFVNASTGAVYHTTNSGELSE